MTLYVQGFDLDHGHAGMSPSEAAEQHRIEIRARSEAQHRAAGVKPRRAVSRPKPERSWGFLAIYIAVFCAVALVGAAIMGAAVLAAWWL